MAIKSKSIHFEGIEFSSSNEFRIWTENQLMQLQDLFLKTKEQVYITKMFDYIKLYANSTLVKHFNSYILSPKDLNYKAYLTAEEVIIQYYKRPDFKINDSFGGYIKHKARQVVFSKKNTLDSCADYIQLEDQIMEIQNNKVYTIPNIREIVVSSFKIYISTYNFEYDYHNIYKLFAKENGQKEFDYHMKEDIVSQCKMIFLDHRKKSFMISFKKDFVEENKLKIKVEFKIRKIIEGLSLDAQRKCYHDNKVQVVTLGDIIQTDDIVEKYDKEIENYDTFDIVEHIRQLVDETGKNPYCDSKSLNLERLIALRNRVVYGEDSADEFFSLFSRKSKILYEKTMSMIYEVLKENMR